MSLRYWRFSEKVMISILFCSLAFGQNNRQANIPSARLPSRGYVDQDMTFMPQQTFQSVTDSNATLIGRWANGSCQAVDVSRNIAYFGNGGYLEVVDISDPANPIELGKVLTPSAVSGVAVSSSYAYVADGGCGLRIIDVSTPSSPQEVGFFDTGDYALGVAVSGSYAYVADGSLMVYVSLMCQRLPAPLKWASMIRGAMLEELPSAAVTPMWPIGLMVYVSLMCPRLPVP